jgi:hypothetical protein
LYADFCKIKQSLIDTFSEGGYVGVGASELLGSFKARLLDASKVRAFLSRAGKFMAIRYIGFVMRWSVSSQSVRLAILAFFRYLLLLQVPLLVDLRHGVIDAAQPSFAEQQWNAQLAAGCLTRSLPATDTDRRPQILQSLSSHGVEAALGESVDVDVYTLVRGSP